jgi:hypothetical protein
MLLFRHSHPFWHPCKQHDRNEKKTRISPLPKPDHSIKCMLERESEEPSSHCPTTNKVQDPNLIVNSLPFTKQAFDKLVDIFKGLSLEKFYNILEYGEDDVDTWLVDYSVQNEEIDQALRNLSNDLRELENELFNIKIWNEINVAPLRSYIEEWVQREMDQVTDERQQEVGTIPVAVDDSNKNATASK